MWWREGHRGGWSLSCVSFGFSYALGMNMAEEIREAIERALGESGISGADFVVEHPAESAHGDYASNVALAAAKQVGKAPPKISEQRWGGLKNNKPEAVERITIAGAGFINFHLSRTFFTDSIREAFAHGDAWGKNTALAGKKILVEYTSPNLFKQLHIGNLMSNIVGESLVRLFEFAGAEVKRFNYPSDIGLTVAKGVWALQKDGGNPSDIGELGRAYQEGNGAYESDLKAKAEIDEVNRKLYAGEDAGFNNIRESGIATSLAHIHAICETLGTRFDFEHFESESGLRGKDLVLAHLADGIFEKSDGAVVFRGEKYGLHTRVFINSAGLPTYEAKDLGLAAIKQEAYPFDLSLTATAAEQDEYFKVVIRAIEEVFPALAGKVRHIGYGFLTLATGKMSSRKGNVITGESLLAEMRERALARMDGERKDEETADAIAVAAIKYMALRQETRSHIVFDQENSLSFEGDSGPYLQYTHARICSVLRKASDEGVGARTETGTAPADISPAERLLYRFPEVVLRAQEEYEPHYVTTYLTELAGAFNTWYAKEQIVDAKDPHSPYKVALAGAVAQTLKNGLWLLGIKAPERM